MPVSRFLTTFGSVRPGEPDVPRNAQGEAQVDYVCVSYVPAPIVLLETRLSAGQLTTAKGLANYLWVYDLDAQGQITAWNSDAAQIRTWCKDIARLPAAAVDAFPLKDPKDFKDAIKAILKRGSTGAALTDDDFDRSGLTSGAASVRT